MKRQIRVGVFETNSSSTHSLTMCSEEEFEKWKAGELLYDKYQGGFIDAKDPEADEYEYRTYEEFREDEYLENFVDSYTTSSGEKVIAFGLFGYEG